MGEAELDIASVRCEDMTMCVRVQLDISIQP